MVYVFLAKGFEEVEALTVVDILRRAEVETKMVSVTGQLEVEGAHGIKVVADTLLNQCDWQQCRLMVLPGGMPGTTNLLKHGGLCKVVNEFASDDEKKIAAICAAPMILGNLGLLKGKKATIYPGMEDYLKDAEPTDRSVVIDGNLITSQGPGTAMEFALTLVDLICGSPKAKELRQDLILK